MMADKPLQLVPKLRFPEFRVDPQWSVSALGNLASFKSGGTPSKSVPEYWNGNIPWISAASMYDTNIHDSERKVTALAIGNGTRVAKAGSLLILTRGSMLYSRVPVGIASIDVAFNQDVRALKTDPNLINYFLLYQLTAQESLIPINDTGIGAGKIDTEDLRKFPVVFPSLDEQQQIIDCLGSLDDLIAAEGRKLDALRQYKKGLMQQLFPQPGKTVPRLRFPEFRGANEWDVRLVGDVFKVTRGLVLAMPLMQDSRSEKTPYPVYSSQTKDRGLAGYYSEYLYQDAITWTTDGANAGDVNFRSGKFYCTNVCGVLLNNDGHANLCTAELINSVSRQHVSFVGNPKLMNGVMATIAIPFPPLAEQQRIARCLSSLDNLLTAQTLKIDALKQHKQGMMQQLFPSLEGQ